MIIPAWVPLIDEIASKSSWTDHLNLNTNHSLINYNRVRSNEFIFIFDNRDKNLASKEPKSY